MSSSRMLQTNYWLPSGQFLRASSLSALAWRVVISISPSATDEHDTDNPHRKGVVVPFPVKGVETTHHHVAGFYSDDRRLLDDLTQFVGAALKAGNAAIVVATESHQD